jgi:hypothetical protein
LACESGGERRISLTMFRQLCSFLCLLIHPLASHAALQETWETGYVKDDVTGSHVLGYWSFDGEAKGLTLSGAVVNSKGKFGAALESFPGFPVEDKKHAAVAMVKSPKGAFTLEMWIKPKAAFEPNLRCYLLDKKYVDHTDFQWQITDADKAGLRRMSVTLGFDAESKTIYSEPLKLPQTCGSTWPSRMMARARGSSIVMALPWAG